MAVRIAKTTIILISEQNVGRGSELDSICDARLNLIVSQLYENYKWPTNRKSTTITISDKTWTVPTDYLKGQFIKLQHPNSSPVTEFEIPLIDYDNYALIDTPNNPGRPERAAVLRSLDTTGDIVLLGTNYPKADQSYTGTLYYTAIQSFDIPDAQAPAFFDLKSLIDLLSNELRGMGYGTELGVQYDPFMLEKFVRRMRENMSDEGIYPQRAKLDRRLFRAASSITWPPRG